jgi:hypothetical protein
VADFISDEEMQKLAPATAPDFIPDEAAPAPIEEPRNRLAEAARHGLTQIIPAQVYTGLRDQAKAQLDIELPDLITPAKPAPGFEPEGFTEHAISIGASLLDPTFGPIFKAAGKIAKPLLLEEEALKRGLQLGLLDKVVNRAVKGAAEFGLLGAAQEASKQAAEGKLDTNALLHKTLIDAGLGATLNQALGPLGEAMARSLGEKRGKAAQLFGIAAREQGELANLDRAADARSILQGKGLASELDMLKSRISGSERRLGALRQVDPELASNEAYRLQLERNALQGVYQDRQAKFTEVVQGPEYQAFMRARNHFKDQKMGGVPLWEQVIDQRGVILPPEEVNALLSVKSDISKQAASALSFQDPLRAVESVEGRRGTIKAGILEPIFQKNVKMKEEELALRSAFSRVSRNLSDKSAGRRQMLFRAAEGRASDAEMSSLAEPEKAFLNHTASLYNNLIRRINLVNASLGLPIVRFRRDYISHLEKLGFLEGWGIKAGRDRGLIEGRRVRSAFRFEQARPERPFHEDPFRAVESYIGPALRRIHMQQPASEAQARTNFLPINIRKYLSEWIQTAVLGGIDPKDASIINAGYEGPLKFAEKISGALTRSVILGNLNIATQQASQIPATALQTGIGYAARGLRDSLSGIPRELLAKSTQLGPRTLFDEMPQAAPGVIRRFDKAAGYIQNAMDKYFFNATWSAGFHYGREKLFLSSEAAVRYADDISFRLHSAYGDLFKAPILRGRSGKAFLPFQTFVFNLWNHLVRDPKVLAELNSSKRTTEALKTIGTMAVANFMYDSLGVPPPFSVASSIPIAGGLRFGIPSPPLQLVAQEVTGLFSGKEEDQKRAIMSGLLRVSFAGSEEDRAKALKDLAKVGSRYVPLGTQIKNLAEGISAANDGYFQVGREVVDLDQIDKAVAVLLGPAKTSSAREALSRNKRRQPILERAARKVFLQQAD